MRIIKYIIVLSIFCLAINSDAEEKLVKIHKLRCLEFINNRIPMAILSHIPQELISQSGKKYPTISLTLNNKTKDVRLTVSFTPYDLFSNSGLIGYCKIGEYKYLVYAYQVNPNLYFNKTNLPRFVIKEYEYFPYIYDGPEFYFKIRNNSIKYIGAEFYK